MSENLNDEFIPILEGAWAVIYTNADGWELEHQQSCQTWKLKAHDEDSAIEAGEKLAQLIKRRSHES